MVTCRRQTAEDNLRRVISRWGREEREERRDKDGGEYLGYGLVSMILYGVTTLITTLDISYTLNRVFTRKKNTVIQEDGREEGWEEGS